MDRYIGRKINRERHTHTDTIILRERKRIKGREKLK